MKDEIQHYGVKGMKWGVRRYQPYPKGSGKVGKFVDRAKQRRDVRKQKKIDKKYIKRIDKNSRLIAAEIYNDAADEMNNGGIKKFNKKWNDKKVNHLKDPKIREEYYKDYEKEFQKVARKHAKAATTESATGNIRTEYKYLPGSFMPTAIHVVTEKGKNVIQQSDNDNVIVFKITHDSKGFIKELIPEGEDTIMHYGVKGMKWGVRRYQPYPKGSRNAGKFLDTNKRKGGSSISVSSAVRSKGREISMARAQREIKNLSTKDAGKVVDRARLESRFKKYTKTPNVGLDRKTIGEYLNRDTMGNDELRRKVKRLELADNMRQEARSMNPEIISIGKKAAAIATPFVVAEVFKRLDGTEFSRSQLSDMGKQAAELAEKWII